MLILAAVLAACGSQGPAPTPTPPRVQVGCFGLDATQCERALAALTDNLPGATPTYVAVSRRLCDGPCPGEERGAWLGHLMIEFGDGRKPETVLIAVDGASVDWKSIETVLVEVTPDSPRLSQPVTNFTLGHCGLNSGIDIDGSFWDPIGVIDPNALDLINSAEARFTLSSQTTATLLTSGGGFVQLARHQGPKFLLLCD